MQTYYSIISVNINHTLRERIGVGMLLVSGEQLYFRVAEDKLIALKGILSGDKAAFARTYLRNLHREVEHTKTPSIPGLRDSAPSWSSKSYIEYLNRYADNLFHFSNQKTWIS